MKRRKFIRSSVITSAVLSQTSILSCSSPSKKGEQDTTSSSPPKISLAQWSLHRSFQSEKYDNWDFAIIAKESFGIDAIEYVAGLYPERGDDESFWEEINQIAIDQGVKSLLIMIDDHGDLGAANDEERISAVENHYQWVNNARITGCHSIRVNAFGSDDKEVLRSALVDGLGRLTEYAAKEGINVIIENHGLYSSEAAFIVEVIEEVNNPYLGTLPDFGNWCTSQKWGSIYRGECIEQYDKYLGVREFMPYAKSVSAKSYDFDESGNQTLIDYYQMMKIVKEFNYDGYIGIEYEGNALSEEEGILATKKLIEKAWIETV